MIVLCPTCKKENDPSSSNCWECHQFLPATSSIPPILDSASILRDQAEKDLAVPKLEITRKRYLELMKLACDSLQGVELQVAKEERETFLEIMQTLWRMKK